MQDEYPEEPRPTDPRDRTALHGALPLDNGALAELLTQESTRTEPPLQTALRRASRRAFQWPEEAAQLVREGRSLQDLPGIGPHLERLILGWMEHPPAMPLLPEIRRGFLTLAQARAALRAHPDWAPRLKGDLQMHTVWSDGAGTIAEMAEAATERGYEYIAITDHSQGLKIARGIDEEQLRRQTAEIEAVNRAQPPGGVRVLRSIELNLDPLGAGDMSASSLAELDVVLACFHSALRRTEDQTERYERALRNPTIQILGHPRGRIYNHRLGLNADWSRVFAVAAELDKAVEIDCFPDRQDLNVDLVRVAVEAGCRISLATDAHYPSQLDFIELGLAAALLAGVPRDRVLNFMGASELLDWVAGVRETAGS